ncbi:MAG TPA: ParB/RepB/Spo0J family partition protein [Thermoanaerobaculia bacterium]|nr:ParB/RepB/Spo0J family partition protein [Thermoanaerobaculia bacterium]
MKAGAAPAPSVAGAAAAAGVAPTLSGAAATAGRSPAIAATAAAREVAIAAIAPDRDQPRSTFSETRLELLAESIRAHGVIEPLVVSPHPDAAARASTPYLLIVGERRWTAARLAGLTTVPVVVREDLLAPADRLMFQIAENDGDLREDLSLWELASAVARACELDGGPHAVFARRHHRSSAWISQLLAFARAEGAAGQALREGYLQGALAARTFLRLNPSHQQRLLAEARRDNAPITVRRVEKLAGRPDPAGRPAGRQRRHAEEAEAESRAADQARAGRPSGDGRAALPGGRDRAAEEAREENRAPNEARVGTRASDQAAMPAEAGQAAPPLPATPGATPARRAATSIGIGPDAAPPAPASHPAAVPAADPTPSLQAAPAIPPVAGAAPAFAEDPAWPPPAPERGGRSRFSLLPLAAGAAGSAAAGFLAAGEAIARARRPALGAGPDGANGAGTGRGEVAPGIRPDAAATIAIGTHPENLAHGAPARSPVGRAQSSGSSGPPENDMSGTTAAPPRASREADSMSAGAAGAAAGRVTIELTLEQLERLLIGLGLAPQASPDEQVRQLLNYL